MKKFMSSVFFSTLGAGAALAAKQLLDKNGGIQPTLDKAKATFNKAKGHPTVASAIAKTTGVVSDLKQRFAANDTTDASKAA
jgi:hypothetical protein